MYTYENLLAIFFTVAVIYTSAASFSGFLCHVQRTFIAFTLFANLIKVTVIWLFLYAYSSSSVSETQVVTAALACIFIMTIADWQLYIRKRHSFRSDAFVMLSVLFFLVPYVAGYYDLLPPLPVEYEVLYPSISCGLLFISMSLGNYSKVHSSYIKRVIQFLYLALAAFLMIFPFLPLMFNGAQFLQIAPFYVLLISFSIQVMVIYTDIKSRTFDEKLKRDKMDGRFGILNVKGFVDESGDIRRICARLDQGVSIAAFDIKCIKNSSIECEEIGDFPIFLYEVIERIKFSLRKHDLFCYVDSNIFSVLLPFTDAEKGKLACLRLREAINEDLLTKGAENGRACTIVFGVARVPRSEPNILPALTRAVEAMIRASRSGLDIDVWDDTLQ